MSDDQVGCEWVSISSDTGLPGLSQTKAVKRLCVCNYSKNICNNIPQKVYTQTQMSWDKIFELPELLGTQLPICLLLLQIHHAHWVV